MLNVKTNNKAKQGGDVLGGFKVWDTNGYEAVVKAIFIGTSKSGAKFAGIHLNIDNQEYREQIYFTNKEGENFYIDKNSQEPKEMPGFQTVNELVMLTTGIGLLDENQVIEDKVLKLYDPESKAETNQSVPCVVEAHGKSIIVGIQKVKEFKQKKNDATGTYENTDEIRETNQINKVFHAETQGTVTEYIKDTKLGGFWEEWSAKNTPDFVIDKTRNARGSFPAPGRPGASSGKETKSLFGGK